MLKRSGTKPLEFTAQISRECILEGGCEAVLDLLFLESPRWRDVKLHSKSIWSSRNLGDEDGLQSLASLKSLHLHDMPLLESLHLRSPYLFSKIDVTKSPNLGLITIIDGINLCLGSIIFNSLTHVCLITQENVENSKLSVISCLALFQAAPHLEYFKGDLHPHDISELTMFPNGSTAMRIVLPHLKDLELISTFQYASPATITIMDHITAPSLQSLNLIIDLSTSESEFSALVHFCQRSQPPLKCLSLYNIGEIYSRERDILVILQCMPNLTDLTLSSFGLTDTLVAALTVKDLNSNEHQECTGLCPSLEHISIHQYASPHTDETTFANTRTIVKMILSRWNAPSSQNLPEDSAESIGFKQYLKSVSLFIRDSDSQVVDDFTNWEVIKKCKAEGLKLSVSWVNKGI